ncbi:MAG: class I SAM-dependent methyltransferase [Deltaproteobacteria bacterium]
MTSQPHTSNYYDEQAQAFLTRTLPLDLSHVRRPFVERLPSGARVLDAGCGSGRDAKAFLEAGFQVTAFDASREMARAASELTGLHVTQCAFLEFRSPELFDGIWACASLLHVPRAELRSTLEHLIALLRPGALLYASFKLGEHERREGERYFNDATPESFTETLRHVAGARLEHTWVVSAIQTERVEWLHALVRREEGNEGAP